MDPKNSALAGICRCPLNASKLSFALQGPLSLQAYASVTLCHFALSSPPLAPLPTCSTLCHIMSSIRIDHERFAQLIEEDGFPPDPIPGHAPDSSSTMEEPEKTEGIPEWMLNARLDASHIPVQPKQPNPKAPDLSPEEEDALRYRSPPFLPCPDVTFDYDPLELDGSASHTEVLDVDRFSEFCKEHKLPTPGIAREAPAATVRSGNLSNRRRPRGWIFVHVHVPGAREQPENYCIAPFLLSITAPKASGSTQRGIPSPTHLLDSRTLERSSSLSSLTSVAASTADHANDQLSDIPSRVTTGDNNSDAYYPGSSATQVNTHFVRRSQRPYRPVNPVSSQPLARASVQPKRKRDASDVLEPSTDKIKRSRLHGNPHL
ncbi:hypothetical protein PLICRDRAFT_90862 [Plicaturopsis crispa FD-325 SS-3]|nr:hypothetical protein PLICRDRAFT_90862 [Plicaturopsis crispa FD-325 SS-3]